MQETGLFIGTSGWAYDDWNGVFYPRGVTGTKRLDYYAARFDSVELNASFYRFPSHKAIQSWNRRLPEGFYMAVKGTRRVTHFNKLKGCEEILSAFMERIMELKSAKVVLWQLPPSIKLDIPLLKDFTSMLPKTTRYAIEFRHESWWNDNVASILDEKGISFVAVSHPSLPGDILPSSDMLYVRFHGLGPKLYDYDYDRKELEGWIKRLVPYLRTKAGILYAFFNNDYRCRAVKNACMFKDILCAQLGS